jgi:Zn-dependent protease
MKITTAPPTPAGYRQDAVPATDGWRRWRAPVAIIALIIAGGAVIALLQPARVTNNYLDPASTGPDGTHALADILAGRGQQIVRETSPAAAVQAASGGATLVVTSTQFLTRGQLAPMNQLAGNLVIVEPEQATLAVLAPDAAIAGISIVGPTTPNCSLPAALLAGSAVLGGTGLKLRHPAPDAELCYPFGQLSSLLQYGAGRRVITVVGSAQFMTNKLLAQFGDAALALNLLGGSRRVIWLVPALAIQSGAASTAGPRSLTSLIPLGAWLVALQLGIALLLAALWRARRLGPIVAEQLPVVVRAAETVEGHGRLYQARRARGRAAAALRTALIDRLAPIAGLPRDASADTVATTLAARSGTDAEQVTTMLYGPLPGTDAALVALAGELDDLERKVRAQ